MLTKKEIAVLEILRKFGQDGMYKILDADDILGEMQEADKPSKTELLQVITNLGSREIINIKLSGLEEYCIQVLPKALVVLSDYHAEKQKAQIIQSVTAKASVRETKKGAPEAEKDEPILVSDDYDFSGVVTEAVEQKKAVTKIGFVDKWIRPLLIALVSGVVAGVVSGFIVGMICK